MRIEPATSDVISEGTGTAPPKAHMYATARIGNRYFIVFKPNERVSNIGCETTESMPKFFVVVLRLELYHVK